MRNPIVGQLGMFVTRENGEDTRWMYGVVVHIFEDRFQAILENGTRYVQIISDDFDEFTKDQPTKSDFTILFKNGKPAMAKKKIFKGYIPEPK